MEKVIISLHDSKKTKRASETEKDETSPLLHKNHQDVRPQQIRVVPTTADLIICESAAGVEINLQSKSKCANREVCTKAREKEATKLKPKSEKKKEFVDAVDGAFAKTFYSFTPPAHIHTLVPSLPLPLAWLQSSLLLPSTLSPCFSRTLTNPSTRRRGPRSNPPEPPARGPTAPLPESGGVRPPALLPPHTPAPWRWRWRHGRSLEGEEDEAPAAGIRAEVVPVPGGGGVADEGDGAAGEEAEGPAAGGAGARLLLAARADRLPLQPLPRR